LAAAAVCDVHMLQLLFWRTRYYMVRHLRCLMKLYPQILSFRLEKQRLRGQVCCCITVQPVQ